ncbi:MAG: glutaredoxin [Lachnospiraceae bacterium]|nr:glutaredoxin [Lachnospiraceae bacterium]
MFKIYGSKMCPECIKCKVNFDKNDIKYEFIDITDSLKSLKEFLEIRDTEEIFVKVKQRKLIGIPYIIGEDGTGFLSWKRYLADKGIEVIPMTDEEALKIGLMEGSEEGKVSEEMLNIAEGQACSLDGSGC